MIIIWIIGMETHVILSIFLEYIRLTYLFL